ncbi:hypothetical protein CFC21_106224 [Triticum aestivum]|uniref:Mediator complex subunit 15 KIX domain-containing protein n=2 Tax=Triticum aestivum TaxID=4565 RepID=A0A9R1MDS8_WHEAT|nr:mediator of RNA polymerase II transcription subunit 15a-like isoform X1 [Triticum aestivum]KAF7105410.1 hypothetical protein CFC21_106224 [Triticum aestivum]
MDANWRPIQGSDPAAGGDPPPPDQAIGAPIWIQPQARTRIVNKISEALKRHLPVSAVSHPDGLNQLQQIAVRFEQRIYDAATTQSDYFRTISLKMLAMETKTQQDPGNDQVIPNQNNSGVNQTSKMQNRYAMAQNAINNGLEQGTSQDIYAPQIQMVGRQQQQQSQQLIYHQHQRPSLQSQQPNITLQPQQQHAQQPAMGLMQPRSQPNQLQESQQHIMSQFQAQPNQLKKQLGMQQQFSMQQRVQTSGGMLLQQNNMDQKNIFIQAQKGLQEASSSTSADFTAQSGHAGAGDWQEDIYQMIQSLKDQYFAQLIELFNKISVKLHHVDSIIPPQKPSEQYDRMKSFKIMLDRILQMLQMSKSTIQPAMRDKIPQYEKQIITILNSQWKPVQPQIQQQLQPPPGK